MSAIDTTFHWVRNPTAINGLQTTYASKRGSDVSGDGTAQNPYASLAKATSIATSGTNIMIDDGEWNESITLNNRNFNWFGNGKTILKNLIQYHNCKYYYFIIESLNSSGYCFCYYEKCIIIDKKTFGNQSGFCCKKCIIINSSGNGGYINQQVVIFENCVLLNITNLCFCYLGNTFGMRDSKNNIIKYSGSINFSNSNVYNSNFTNSAIPSTAVNSINDAITGQTLADYFNYVHPNVLANPSNASIDDWLKCDFTAKEGSKNIGAGEKGTTIGLNQGYTMYADNSANDMFKESNGATLKNTQWDNTLNGYVLIQKERVCAGATASTITLDSSASSVDDYYNNLFVGIVAGDGYGEIFKITDYDGATKTATIDGSWNTTPTTNSIYTISGTIFSATKDFGKAIKVKRNWTFADNFTTIADGRWAEFMTNLTSEGKELPVNCFLYEYSVDGTTWVQGHTADDLVSATNGENKVTDKIYGDCSPNYNEASAKELVMRYIRVNVHIGFNI